MLKITEIDRTDKDATFKLEGRISSVCIDEIRRISDARLEYDLSLTFDLADVSFIERPAVPVLRELRSAGIKFKNCSPFICEQLKGVLK